MKNEEKRFEDICATNNFSTVHQKVFHDSEFSNIDIGTCFCKNT